ncbi:hypothetical protein IAW_05838 [Bacillus cereus str. Schrouff]|uniref:hypothetical protein n=1 Tax=Bacillus cereus TaxID=1396 RepID=UPI000330C0B4|nr:hypothetical protein [Bacillus cereus]EOO05019.1 hypothetical protein IAW_05838 [Bacillus cereus str. Schrouff]EOO81647.1 hypothetical protein IGY_05669 [Bacillus cereus K-5975c]
MAYREEIAQLILDKYNSLAKGETDWIDIYYKDFNEKDIQDTFYTLETNKEINGDIESYFFSENIELKR